MTGATISPIILIYHHLAKHNSNMRTATKDRLSERALVEGCQDMLDLIFWEKQMYECQVNSKSRKSMQEMADKALYGEEEEERL